MLEKPIWRLETSSVVPWLQGETMQTGRDRATTCRGRVPQDKENGLGIRLLPAAHKSP